MSRLNAHAAPYHPLPPAPLHAHTHAELYQGCTADQVRRALEGRTLETACRKGKYLWFQLSGAGPTPVLHFGAWCCGAGRGREAVRGSTQAKAVAHVQHTVWAHTCLQLGSPCSAGMAGSVLLKDIETTKYTRYGMDSNAPGVCGSAH